LASVGSLMDSNSLACAGYVQRRNTTDQYD